MSRTTRRITGVAVAGSAPRPSRHRPSPHPPPGPTRARHRARRSSTIQILSFNDFHGNLEPPSGSSGASLTHDSATPTRRQRPRLDPSTSAASSTSRRTSRQARVGHAEHRHRRRGRHGRRLAAAVGGLPRRADRRGDEQARPRRHGRGQPRVRRGLQGAPAPRSTAAASTTATASTTRTPAPPAPSPARTSTYLAANVLEKATGKTILPAYTIKNVQRRQGRLHRHDPQGHADHRHGLRRRRASSSPTRSRPPTRSCRCSRRRASTRSSCSSTRAATVAGAVHALRLSRARAAARSSARLADHPDRQGPRPGHRHDRLRPHAPAVRLQHSPTRPASRASSPRPRRSVASSPRPTSRTTAARRHRPPDDGRLGQQDRDARRRQGRGRDGAHRQVQGRSSRPIADQGHRPDRRLLGQPHGQRRGRVAAR